MLGSALEEAHALSVTTRKHMRSVPIEDPLKELERIEEYVRTHDYAQAYAFLRSPPNVQVPHRVKGESGAGYIAGALLLAPIWLLAAPLFLTGVAKSLIQPAPDERLNQRYRLELIDYLAQLKRRAQAELAADAANAEKLAAHLFAYGLQGFTPVRSHMVRKDWETFRTVRAGSIRKRRNGWHLVEMGDLHIGNVNACFYSEDGYILDLPLRDIGSVIVVKRCVVLLNLRRPKGKQMSLFVPGNVSETVAHLDAARARAAAIEAPAKRRLSVRSATNVATQGVQSLMRLRSKKDS